jgi:LacI family transcriptional regulator
MNSEMGRKVIECADRLGYQRAPKTEAKKTVHFVIYKRRGRVGTASPFFSEMIEVIEGACATMGYALSVAYLDGVNGPEAVAKAAGEIAKSSLLLLLATQIDEETVKLLLKNRTPLVLLDSLFPYMPFNTVTMNNKQAGWLVGNYFLERGHRQIGLITSTPSFNNMVERQQGLEEALSGYGCKLDPQDIFMVEPTIDGSVADIKGILSRRGTPLPTAFFATNDVMALGAYRAFHELGFKIPDDMSIIGMDNLSFSSAITPQLTTIDVPKREMGEQAVAHLIRMAEHKNDIVVKTMVDVALVERGSVKTIRTNR